MKEEEDLFVKIKSYTYMHKKRTGTKPSNIKQKKDTKLIYKKIQYIPIIHITCCITSQ